MSTRDIEQIKRDIVTATEIDAECSCDYATDTGAYYCVNCVARAWEAEAAALRAEVQALRRILSGLLQVEHDHDEEMDFVLLRCTPEEIAAARAALGGAR